MVPEGLCVGFGFRVCVGMCECMLVLAIRGALVPPCRHGSALSCDRAGQPRDRAGRLGGRPACRWGVLGSGCLCVGVSSVASCGVGCCKLVCGRGERVDAHRRRRVLLFHSVRHVGARWRARGRCRLTNFLGLRAYLRLLVLLVRGVPHAG